MATHQHLRGRGRRREGLCWETTTHTFHWWDAASLPRRTGRTGIKLANQIEARRNDPDLCRPSEP